MINTFLKELIKLDNIYKSCVNIQKTSNDVKSIKKCSGQRKKLIIAYQAGIVPTSYHSSWHIPWARDLMERNIYSHSLQIDKVTKQWETYEDSDHHVEQLCE